MTGRRRLSCLRTRDGQSSGSLPKRKLAETLVLIEGVRHRRKPDQANPSNPTRVRGGHEEDLTVAYLRRGFGYDWPRSPKQVGWRKDLGVELPRQAGTIAAPGAEDSAIGEQERGGVIDPRHLVACH